MDAWLRDMRMRTQINKCTDLSTQLRKTESKLTAAERRVDDATREKDDVQRNFEHAKKSFDGEMALRRRQAGESADRILSLEGRNRDLSEALREQDEGDLRAETTERTRNTILEDQVASLEKSMDLACEEVAELRQWKGEAEIREAELERMISLKDNELQSCRGDVMRMQDRVKREEEDMANEREHLETESKEIADLLRSEEERRTLLERQVEILRNNLRKMRTKKPKLTSTPTSSSSLSRGSKIGIPDGDESRGDDEEEEVKMLQSQLEVCLYYLIFFSIINA
jgi:chromosome segregation ATPase